MPETVFLRGDSKSNFEGMTKEQILAAIAQAIQTGQIAELDTGFITRLKEINKGRTLQIWLGTSAEFNALEQQETNVLYIKTDDTSPQDISNALLTIGTRLDDHDEQLAEHEEQLGNISGKYVKLRAAYVFGEIAAGSKEEVQFNLNDSVYEDADGNPVVSVSPILDDVSAEYNTDFEYYGYIIHDSTATPANKLVFGVYNRGTTAAQPPDVACVVI